MKILVLGGSGYIGSAITNQLSKHGHEVVRMSVPRPPLSQQHKSQAWNELWEKIPPDTFSHWDAIYYFGGESINGYWSEKKKQRLYHSRATVCRLLAKKLTRCGAPPRYVVASSAVGIYGNRKDEFVDEDSAPGTNFLAKLAVDWETAWDELQEKNVSITKIRTPVVIGPGSLMLKKILPIFKLGLGGKIGNGKQWLSWVHRDDLAEICCLPLDSQEQISVINACSPHPVTNYEFTKELGKALKRPTFFAVPETIVRTVFGEMGESTVLLSCRAVPKVAEQHGFSFKYPHLREALQNAVGSN